MYSINAMRERMRCYQQIRDFFHAKSVLEVETPILSPYGTTDVHIDSFVADYHAQNKRQSLYLQTSPEFYMKRLLTEGIGDCFQICKVFRHEPSGRHHRPEFTMLEWYRVGFSMHDLMVEVAALVTSVCPDWQALPVEIISYAEAFATIGVDPHQDSLDTLKDKTLALSGYAPKLSDERDEWLDFLLVTHIESRLGQEKLTFLTHYPASMAALSQKTVDAAGNLVAERFELYYQGVELANGFHELTDAAEQQARFEDDNKTRQALGKPSIPYDQQLIQALNKGLPDCSGVALGLDRVLMLKLGLNSLEQL